MVKVSNGHTIGYVYVLDHLRGLGYGKYMMHHVLTPPSALLAFPTKQ